MGLIIGWCVGFLARVQRGLLVCVREIVVVDRGLVGWQAVEFGLTGLDDVLLPPGVE